MRNLFILCVWLSMGLSAASSPAGCLSVTPVVMPASNCDSSLAFLQSCVCDKYLDELTVMYTGQSGVTVNVYEDKNQHHRLHSFTNVQQGDLLTIGDGGKHLKKKLYLSVQGMPHIEIDTGCKGDKNSLPGIELGQVYGNFIIAGYADQKGNACSMTSSSSTCECEKHLMQFTLIYSGSSGTSISVYEDKNHHHLLAQFSSVQRGDLLTIDNNGKHLKKKTYLSVTGMPDIIIDTDCKKSNSSFAVGNTFGDFTVAGLIDEKGTRCGMTFSCNGDGAVTLAVSGGVAPYSFRWSDGSTGQGISGLCAGYYYFTVTDANGCSTEDSVYVGCSGNLDSQPLTVMAAAHDISCLGANDGSIELIVSGGVAPYQYRWSTGQTSPAISGLQAGFYIVTVTDAAGATVTASAEVAPSSCIIEERCFSSPEIPGVVSATTRWVIDHGTQTVTIRTTFSKTFVDNTYGVNAVGWPNGHSFGNLTGSDHLQLVLYNNDGVKSMDFKVDYISASTDASSGYKCLGVAGGDGRMLLGNATDVLYATTSLAENFNQYGYALTVNSPATNSSYVPNPAYPNWIFDVWYEVTVKLSAFGPAGFGYPDLVFVHASPSKTGRNSEPVEFPCPGSCSLSLVASITPNSVCDTVPVVQQVCNCICIGAMKTISVMYLGQSGKDIYVYAHSGQRDLIQSFINVQYGDILFVDASALLNRELGAKTYFHIAGGQEVKIYTDCIKEILGKTFGSFKVVEHSDVEGNSCDVFADCTDACPCDGEFRKLTFLFSGRSGSDISVYEDNRHQRLITSFANVQEGALITIGNGTYNLKKKMYFSIPGEPDVVIETECKKIRAGQAFGGFTLVAYVDKKGQVCSLIVPCAGDGSINVTMSGGVPPYSFTWSNGGLQEDISGLCSGYYYVTVSDAAGCLGMDSFFVGCGNICLMTLESSARNVSCAGASDGAVSLSISNGSAPFTYRWSTGDTTARLNTLPGGIISFSVTVTDASGCSASLSQSLLVEEPAPLAVATNIRNASCFTASDGSIDLTVSGGTAPFHYLWSTGSHQPSIAGLIAGTYTVTVTDANNCIIIDSLITVGEPAMLSLGAVTSPPTCHDGTDGTIDLTVAGGTPPFSYIWSNGENVEDIRRLKAGSFHVSVEDASGCSATLNIEVLSPQPVTVTSLTENISCFGENDGSIDITISGGRSPYIFNWSNGSRTEDISSLFAGNYFLTVTDDNGCTISEAFSIREPDPLEAVINSAGDVSCFGGNDGTLCAQVSGGTAPYLFNWSSGATAACAIDLIAGIHSLTATDKNGCRVSLASEVSEPASLQIESSLINHVSCFNGSDGSIELTVIGGMTPYHYMWSNGQTASSLTGLTAGSFMVTVIDANGCSLTDTFTVAQSEQLMLGVRTTPPLCSNTSDGAIDLIVSGGTSPFTFNWSNGQITEDLSGAAGGTYEVSVVDAKGCDAALTVEISAPPAIIITSFVSDATCFGKNDGNINVSVTGGLSPYSFAWSNGAATESLSELSAGDYLLTITDDNGCAVFKSFTVYEPAQLEAVINLANDVSCFGENDGMLCAQATGGTAPYSFAWSSGAAEACAFGLIPATYTITITDEHACTATAAAQVNEPMPLLASAMIHDVPCFSASNGSIDLTVSGGTMPYSYFWSNGQSSSSISGLVAGTYIATITDDNGCRLTDTFTVAQSGQLMLGVRTSPPSCSTATDGTIDLMVTGGVPPFIYNWSTGDITEDLTGLAAGTYLVTVIDANGCDALLSIAVTAPPSMMIASLVDDVSCFGENDGSIQITVAGGVSPYSYAWSNGAETEDVSSVSAGSYSLTVTDDNGCTVTGSFIVSEPAQLHAIIGIIDEISCHGSNDASLCAEASGGVMPYTFIWSTGDSGSCISGLYAGTYYVIAADAHACSVQASAQVSEPPPIQIASAVTDVNCFGGINGSVDITVFGGTLPYNYSWSNGAASEDLTFIEAGDYTITIIDNNGCTASETVSVAQPSAILLSAIVTNPGCDGTMGGGIDLSVAGGIAPYYFEWTNGRTSEDLSELTAGTYGVTITDARGCEAMMTYEISGPSPLQLFAFVQPIRCRGGSDGSIDLHVTGGTAPYVFAWSTGDMTDALSGLTPDEYSVTVTDLHGCTASESFIVDELPAMIVSIEIVSEISCDGQADGVLCAQVIDGAAPFSYAWSTGDVTDCILHAGEGTYDLTVTDANGCSAAAFSTTLDEPSVLELTPHPDNVNCYGAGDGGVALEADGGTFPYQYAWSNGSSAQNLTDVEAGTYSVTVIDAHGCRATISATVGQPAPLALGTLITGASCPGESDGYIDLLVQGGVAPYTFVWSTGDTTENLSGLPAGLYSVEVEDVNGCMANLLAEVNEPASIILTAEIISESSAGTSDGAIDISVSGGMAPYSYLWSTGDTTQDLTGISAGIYSVTVTDASGCTISDTFTVPADPRNGNRLQLQVYPNPYKDVFFVEAYSSIQSPARLRVVDIFERVITSRDINVTRGITIQSIDMGDIPAGVYYLIVTMGDEMDVVKIERVL